MWEPQMRLRVSLFGPLLSSGCEVLISGDEIHKAQLFDAELALVDNATSKRRHEFVETRLLAHEALQRIGRDGPILRGWAGEPLCLGHCRLFISLLIFMCCCGGIFRKLSSFGGRCG